MARFRVLDPLISRHFTAHRSKAEITACRSRHDDHPYPDPTYRRSETRDVRPSQEDHRFHAAALSGKFRAVDLGGYRWRKGQNAGSGGRRAVFQRPCRTGRSTHGRGLWGDQSDRRPERPAFHPCGLEPDPETQGRWRHHPVCQPQSRRAQRRFRDQV